MLILGADPWRSATATGRRASLSWHIATEAIAVWRCVLRCLRLINLFAIRNAAQRKQPLTGAFESFSAAALQMHSALLC
jgi:hypothetical protein